MKKTNKKGFTLIELLAVIIILGVLMIIAIPSVTQYISNSRKSAFAQSASGYIDDTRNMVNQATKVQLFDVNTLYLIPVGHEDGKSCVAVEKGGRSPFSDTWEYAYVGVTYNGKNYNYYFVAKDGSNQGINFVSQKDLADNLGDLVVSGNNELTQYTDLKDLYDGATSQDYLLTTPAEGSGMKMWTEPQNKPESVKGLVETVTANESGKVISTIKVLSVSDCK